MATSYQKATLQTLYENGADTVNGLESAEGLTEPAIENLREQFRKTQELLFMANNQESRKVETFDQAVDCLRRDARNWLEYLHSQNPYHNVRHSEPMAYGTRELARRRYEDNPDLVFENTWLLQDLDPGLPEETRRQIALQRSLDYAELTGWYHDIVLLQQENNKTQMQERYGHFNERASAIVLGLSMSRFVYPSGEPVFPGVNSEQLRGWMQELQIMLPDKEDDTKRANVTIDRNSAYKDVDGATAIMRDIECTIPQAKFAPNAVDGFEDLDDAEDRNVAARGRLLAETSDPPYSMTLVMSQPYATTDSSVTGQSLATNDLGMAPGLPTSSHTASHHSSTEMHELNKPFFDDLRSYVSRLDGRDLSGTEEAVATVIAGRLSEGFVKILNWCRLQPGFQLFQKQEHDRRLEERNVPDEATEREFFQHFDRNVVGVGMTHDFLEKIFGNFRDPNFCKESLPAALHQLGELLDIVDPEKQAEKVHRETMDTLRRKGGSTAEPVLAG